jgi:signal transduction histidine kinase
MASTDNDLVRILIVDDNPAKRLSLISILEQNEGLELVEAGSASEALRHLLHEGFAAILLDIHMPDMDGFALAELIRQRDKIRHTPILFITGVHTSEIDRSRGYALGAVDYLFLPVVPEFLRAKVSVFADLFRLRQAIANQAHQMEITKNQLELEVEERRRAEEAIAALNQTLEERAAQLESTNREIEAFAYSVSHDLRTPLRHIEGFSQILTESSAGKLDEESQDALVNIEASVRRMSELIDDLLYLSRVSTSAMNCQEVNISALCHEIAQSLQRSQPDRPTKFVIQSAITTLGDERLLRVALENLFGNAWKFSSRQAKARIEFGCQESVYYVRDNGVGFDMAYSSKLFTPFERLHSDDEFPGTGIGLATVQRIIHRHGGRIWAESSVGKGTCFYFTLAQRERAND